ncbi:unnamed protein product [Psylliodes chrysocephalus]|uniref:Uncharacterized protein n=1 Tax=Psylliodes chrysocephalus TaxID=3402493 RepID=A0A9P0GFC3_9CUCU|nr:unnamed protein product [Psylliodes chrysocephala]
MNRKKVIKTRGQDSHPVFGLGQDFKSQACLPTYEEMMQCFFFVQIDLKGDRSKQPPDSEVAKIVANKIQHIWNLASLSTVTHNRIVAMITYYHKKYRNLIKPLKQRNTPFLQSKIDNFKTQSKRLFDICLSIREGYCPDNLSKKDPGKMGHARWLTTANRLLRLYISTELLSENLILLANFVMKVYAPVWFSIKTQPSIQYGSVHLYEMIHKSREFPDKIKTIINRVISTNAYFAHPENILLAMITDERVHIRELGIRRILKARQSPTRLSSKNKFRSSRLYRDHTLE